MTITYEPVFQMDKSPTSIVWMPGPDGWKCFKGPRFDRYVVRVRGTLDAIAQELQDLRDSCPQGPAAGWHTVYEFVELHCKDNEYESAVQFLPLDELRVSLRVVVTDEENPFGGKPAIPPPPGEPLPQFGPVIREYIAKYIEECEKNP